MYSSRKSLFLSIVLPYLILIVFCSSLISVQSDFNPGEIIDQTKNLTDAAADHTRSFIDGTTSTLNDTKNAAENAIQGTTTAFNDTKNAAENVVNDTKDAYHGVENVANDVKGNGAPAHAKLAGQGHILLFLFGLCLFIL